jgi:hypothetical protein
LPRKGEQGADFARYQTRYDMRRVAAEGGVTFGFIKAGEGLGGFGLGTEAYPSFLAQGLASKGVFARGPYWFYRPDLRRPEAQAAAFVRTVNETGDPGELEWMVDLETPVVNGQAVNLSPHRPYLESDLKLFFEELQRLGVPRSRTGTYSRMSWLHLWTPNAHYLTDYAPVHWVAGYPFNWPSTYTPRIAKFYTAATTRYWQWDNGEMPWSQGIAGIDGRADRNVCLLDPA